MTSIIAVVEVTAFLTVAVLFSICLISTIGRRVQQDSSSQRELPRLTVDDAPVPHFSTARVTQCEFTAQGPRHYRPGLTSPTP